MQITGQHLKKRDWKISSDGQRENAWFRSFNGSTYSSSQFGGGRFMQGLWWHKSEKAAKASAFYQFLVDSNSKGQVRRDLKTLVTGQPLAFGGSGPNHQMQNTQQTYL